jgi:hypothetical protein
MYSTQQNATHKEQDDLQVPRGIIYVGHSVYNASYFIVLTYNV